MADLTALLIDVSHESAALIKAHLERNDVEVVAWTRSGTGWITPLQEHKPDFVVIDQLLPKRDGIYCIEKARQLLPAAAIVFMHSFSGALANEVELKAFAVGAAAVVQKPLVEKRFDALIARLSEKQVAEQRKKMKSVIFALKK